MLRTRTRQQTRCGTSCAVGLTAPSHPNSLPTTSERRGKNWRVRRSETRGSLDRYQHPDRVRAWASRPATTSRTATAGRILPFRCVTASELLHCVHRAVQSDVRAKRSAFVKTLLERFPLLPIDLATARLHAQVRAELAAVGNVIGPNDLWLAATCFAHGLTIVTANVREFARVPGLGVEVWGEPEERA
jgi:tRNA(fMet)-specific endonuclease VapC